MTSPDRQSGRTSVPNTPSSRASYGSSIEPKSELLRHALEASMAAHTGTVAEPKHAQTEALRKTDSDPWIENAQSEEETSKATPARRPRRPSDGALGRMRNQRELQAENDSLRNVQMDLKIRLEALQNQHNKTLDELEDLREENERLALKVQNMDEMENELNDLREQNQEILSISEETVSNMERREGALQEASDIIIAQGKEISALRKDKVDLMALVKGIEQLKTQAAKVQSGSNTTDGYETANEQPRYPPRVVNSSDESRPSTSYNDSDYFSGPTSPHGKSSQDSMSMVTERAQKFVHMEKEDQRSRQRLSKRLSNASLKSSKKKEEPAPQVPRIPEAYQQQPVPSKSNRTHGRVDTVRNTATVLSPALAYDPYGIRPSDSVPHTPTSSLRTTYQSDLSLNTSSHSSRPTSNNTQSPLTHRSRQFLRGADPPSTPARQSSRAAPTSYTPEQHNTAPDPEARSEAGTETTWGLPPPSVASESLTTVLDANNYRGPWYNQISSWGTPNRAGASDTGARAGGQQASYTETNFLFNPAEDEDEFVEKTRSLGRRR